MHDLKKIIFFLILFSIFYISGQSQTEIIELKNRAELELKENNLDKALDLLIQAEQQISAGSNSELGGDCFYLSGHIYSKKQESSSAIKYFQKSVNVYDKIKHKEKLIDAYYRIGLEYIGMEAFEKAANYFEKSYMIQKNSSSKEIFRTLQYIGNCQLYLHRPDSALFYFDILYKKSKAVGDTTYILSSLLKQVDASKQMKRDDKALEKNLLVLEILKKQNNYKAMSGIMNNIGYNYVFLNKYPEAISAFEKSLEYGEKDGLSDNIKANIFLNIGVCMQNSGDIKNAILKLQSALKIRKEQANYKECARIENIIALVYYKNKKDLYNAGVYSESSIDNAEKSGDKELLRDCYDTYSKVLQAGTDYEKALEIYKKYLALRDSMMVEQRLKEQYLSQRILDLEKNEKELKLKIADEEVKDLAMRQLKLEAEKKQKDIDLLRKQNELEASKKERLLQSLKLKEEEHKTLIQHQQIKDLETQKAFQELETKRQEALKKEQIKEVQLLKAEQEKTEAIIARQTEEKKKAILIMAFMIIISALILFVLFITRKKNKKLASQNELIKQKNEELNIQNEEILTQKEYLQVANNQISLKNLEIERKNSEITDSILYAKRIQAAVLPPESVVSENKPDHFVYWKPKDIVSGDFYWIKDIDNLRLIAVADCTGHGVPGAFMSMLGISFLNEIVAHQKITTAASILEELRNMVKTALRQTGRANEQKDGMDLALCIINSENNELQYAGAYNPLVFIRNNELNVLAADKMPIGIHYREKPFSNHVINIQKNDMFYLFSDGYMDQFGGSDGRKFMMKNFRQLLLEIHQTPFLEQNAVLDKILIEWMNYQDQDGVAYKQVDDILIVGVKI
jgi:serine phosphatase RsbU (regulator of sigma subunit)/tetratricopeptide (TPR) repeat protein